MDPSFDAIIRQHPLLVGLSSEEVDALISQGRVVSLRAGEILMREGEKADEFFFILQGAVEVSRRDPHSSQKFVLASFESGDVVGEVALLDQGNRSADVLAKNDVKAFAIPFSIWQTGKEKNPYLYQIFFRVAQNLCGRLRNLNQKTLLDKVRDLQDRFLLGRFFIYLLGFACVYTYLIEAVKVFNLGSFRTYLVIAFTLFFLFGSFLYMHRYHIPLKTFGVTTEGWKRSIYEGAIFTLPILGGIAFAKWVLVHWGWFVDVPFLHITAPGLGMLFYVLLIVPLQEFVARGAIQGLLSQFLIGKDKDLVAIGMSGLIFGMSHLFISFYLALGVLVVNFYLGWIYVRNQNLLSVWIAHAMIGVWSLDILGF